jgi:co-chaperonin GroES (HSP10)
LFGERVALQLVEEDYEGLIVPAATERRMHMLAKVIAVGEKTKFR